MWQRASLKQRLLALALAAITLAWLGATAFTYHEVREEFDEMLDAHLAQTASLLAAQASHEIDEIDEIDEIETEHAPLLHKYMLRVAFQVWEEGGLLRLHSANAPQHRLTDKEKGFSDITLDGRRWRVFSTWDEEGEYLIQVAERADLREELASDIAGNLLRPLGFSLPLLALLLWVAVTRGLRPLDKLANEVGQREPDNLTPLDASSAPREVMPLIERLNRLFARIGASMQKERRFTADAAHELRTPIAAIKAQAQVAQAATGDEERRHALDNAILGCNRAAHLIDQLLTIARIDTLSAEATEQCHLRALAAEAIAAIAPLAIEKGSLLELPDGGETVVRGDGNLLRILLRNLLDNAISHTPSGTTIRVIIGEERGAACLSVCDNGPGIPEDEKEKVLERFYRPLGTKASGSGLGLSIVKRIAEIHGATLNVTTSGEGKGLNVKVIFTGNARETSAGA